MVSMCRSQTVHGGRDPYEENSGCGFQMPEGSLQSRLRRPRKQWPGAFLWLKEADLGAWGRLRKLLVTSDWSGESRAGKAQLHAEGFL